MSATLFSYTGSVPPVQRRREAVLTAVMLFVWAVWAWWLAANIWSSDLAALWFAGHFHAIGQDALVYDAPAQFFGGTPPGWIAAHLAHGGTPAGLSFPYVYPPLWAGLIAPLTGWLEPIAFFRLFLALHVALLAGSVLLAERIARPAGMPRLVFIGWGLAVLTLSAPVRASLYLNQPTIGVTFLVLLAVACLRERPRLAGGVLAVAAAIKLTPLVYALLCVQARRPRALVVLVLGLAALTLASFALMGTGLHQAFLEQLGRAGQNSVWARGNPSLRLLLLDLLPAGEVPGTFVWMPGGEAALVALPRWLGPVAAVVALLIALPAAVLAVRRPGAAAVTLGLLGLSIGLAVFGPVSWLHYFVLPMLIAPALGSGLGRGATLIVLAQLLLANSDAVLSFFPGDADGTFGYVALICLSWLVTLAATVVALSRHPKG